MDVILKLQNKDSQADPFKVVGNIVTNQRFFQRFCKLGSRISRGNSHSLLTQNRRQKRNDITTEKKEKNKKSPEKKITHLPISHFPL